MERGVTLAQVSLGQLADDGFVVGSRPRMGTIRESASLCSFYTCTWASAGVPRSKFVGMVRLGHSSLGGESWYNSPGGWVYLRNMAEEGGGFGRAWGEVSPRFRMDSCLVILSVNGICLLFSKEVGINVRRACQMKFLSKVSILELHDNLTGQASRPLCFPF